MGKVVLGVTISLGGLPKIAMAIMDLKYLFYFARTFGSNPLALLKYNVHDFH